MIIFNINVLFICLLALLDDPRKASGQHPGKQYVSRRHHMHLTMSTTQKGINPPAPLLLWVHTHTHTHTLTPQGSDYCPYTSRPFINVQSLTSRALTQPPAHLYSYQKHTHTHTSRLQQLSGHGAFSPAFSSFSNFPDLHWHFKVSPLDRNEAGGV